MTPKAIRSDIVSRLSGNTEAGTNVFGQRLNPITVNTLPALAVFTTNRSATNVDYPDGDEFMVDVEVEIDAIVAANGTWADDVDDLLEEVKGVLFGTEAFLVQFIDTAPTYSEEIILHDNAEKKMATGVLTLTVRTKVDY